MKYASCQNGMDLFDISTAKSAPMLRCYGPLPLECASRHDSVHFFPLICPGGSAPFAFASLLFDSPEPPTSQETHSVSRPLYFVAYWHLLSYDFSLSELLSSDSLRGCAFPSVRTVGRLTSKLLGVVEAHHPMWLQNCMILISLPCYFHWLPCDHRNASKFLTHYPNFQ